VEEALKRNQASAGIKGSRQGVQTARTHQKNREKLKLRCENGRRVNCLPNHHTVRREKKTLEMMGRPLKIRKVSKSSHKNKA
jgi:hypothetical protein